MTARPYPSVARALRQVDRHEHPTPVPVATDWDAFVRALASSALTVHPEWFVPRPVAQMPTGPSAWPGRLGRAFRKACADIDSALLHFRWP